MRGLLFEQTGCVGFEDELDFVADAAEGVDEFFALSLCVRRVFEAPVVAIYLAGKGRARLVGVSANGDHGVDPRVEELVEVLGSVSGYVDADFLHDLYGLWMHVARGLGSGGEHLVSVAERVSEDAFGHVAAAGVSGAEIEQFDFFIGEVGRLLG